MTDSMYEVNVQATSQDLSTATGQYDDHVEYGKIAAEEFWNVLQHFVRIQPLPDDASQDICPSNLIVDGPYGLFTLEPYGDGVNVYAHDYEAQITAEQAYHYVTGQADLAELRAQAGVTQPVSAAVQQVSQQPVTAYPEGPGTARRWTGNILAGFFVLMGLLFAVVGLVQNTEGIVVSLIVALIFLAIFGGLAWFSRSVIGGIKKGASQSRHTNQQDNSGMAQGMMAGHMMNMNDSTDSDDGGGYDD